MIMPTFDFIPKKKYDYINEVQNIEECLGGE